MTCTDYVHAVRRAALDRPTATAFEEEGKTVSFSGLVERSERMAHMLGGAMPAGAMVGVRLPQGRDYAASVLAARMAGFGVVLLDPRQPASRDLSLCADADVAAIIGEGLGDEGPPAMSPDLAGLPSARQAAREEPLAEFVIGTSGSTGKPKAVVHDDGSMLSWGKAAAAECGYRPGDVVVSMSSFATLGGFVGVTTGLLSGATQRCLDLGSRGVPALVDALRDGRVTSFRGTPTLVRTLGSVPGFGAMTTGLETLTLYGEPLSWGDVEAIRRFLPPTCRIRVAYGSTEAGGSSWFLGEPPESGGKVHAGRPYAGVSMTILDEAGHPVPRGTEGELVVGGTHNSLGTLVAGRFLPHRLTPHGLPSGDLGRLTEDGGLELLGRLDRAVKVNGVRIDLSEVEAVVRGCPGVARAEVVASPRANGHRIVAFVLMDGDGGDPRAVERLARSRLPGSTAPRVVPLEELPTLSVGKVDLARLSAMAEALP